MDTSHDSLHRNTYTHKQFNIWQGDIKDILVSIINKNKQSCFFILKKHETPLNLRLSAGLMC